MPIPSPLTGSEEWMKRNGEREKEIYNVAGVGVGGVIRFGGTVRESGWGCSVKAIVLK